MSAAAIDQSRNGSLRVVIVDDHLDQAASFAVLLHHAFRCDVTPCVDAASCLQAIEHRKPQLVFIDLALPVVNGFELLKVIQSQFPHSMRLVALTGLADFANERRCLEAGFHFFERKPVTIERLAEIIRNCHNICDSSLADDC